MLSQDYSRSNYASESTDLFFHFPTPTMKGCMTCPNHGSCALLANNVSKLKREVKVASAFSPYVTKKIRVFFDHLYRQKFTFPRVANISQCWFHNKFGVVQNLIDHASELLNSKNVA